MRNKIEKINIIIPAYNEASNIVNVIESLKSENPSWDIVVINDCSKDNTGFLAESTVRPRHIIHILSLELFGKSLKLNDFPTKKSIQGIGMSDWEGYANLL